MNQDYAEKEGREQESNLREYWQVLLKRKWIVAAFALPLFAGVSFYSFTAKPVYTAKGTLLIEKEPNILNFEAAFQIETFRDDFYQTQFKVLQSRSLADNVIEKMKLDESPRFAGKGSEAEKGKSGAQNSGARTRLIDQFLKKLTVNPIPQTRLVEVQWKAQDPKFAAEVVNALFDSFIYMSIELKYAKTQQATEFLAKQISELKSEIEEKQREMQKYGAEKNIIALSETETTIIETLGALNKALTEAQIDRLKKEAYYNEIKNASPDNIPDAMTNPMIQRLREDYGRLNRDYMKNAEIFKPDYPEMQRLKAELDSAKALLLSETDNLIKAAYSDYQAALRREQSLNGAYNRQKQEAIQLNSNAIPYNSLKIEIANRKNLLESLIQRESETGVAAQMRGLGTSNVRILDRAEVPLRPSSPKKKLNMILALMIGLFGGAGLAFLLESLDSSVKNHMDVEKATGGTATLGVVPTFSQNMYWRGHGFGGSRKVNVKIGGAKNGAEGAGSGGKKKKKKEDKREKERKERLRVKERAQRGAMLDLGGGGSLEERKESPGAGESVEAKKGEGEAAWVAEAAVPVKAVKPEIKSIELIAHLSPKSNLAESYRTIRTSLLLSSADRKPKAIVVTSALPEEGKSVTLSNLAVTLAQANKNVLIVDSDFRKPTQHRIFTIRNVNGLTDYLTADLELKALIKATRIPKLFLINVGPEPPNPAELLGSEKMDNLIETLKHSFDFILFDSPPVLTVSDAMVMGPGIDGTILVVWGGKTTKDALKQAKKKLDTLNIKCLGVVINNLNVREHDYYYMRHYYGYYGEGKGNGKTT